MDVADIWPALPVILFTLLAILLASTIFGKKAAPAPPSGSRSDAPAGKERRGSEREVDIPAPALRADEGKGAGAEDVGEVRTGTGGQLAEAEEQKTAPTGRRARTGAAGWQDTMQGSSETVGEGDHKSATEAQTVSLKTTSLAHEHFQDVVIPTKTVPCYLALERDDYIHHFPEVDVQKSTPESDPEPGLEQEDLLAVLDENLAEYSPENEDDEDMIAVGMEAEDLTLRYALGKLRTSQLEEMMTKEKAQEEQRIEFTTDFTSL